MDTALEAMHAAHTGGLTAQIDDLDRTIEALSAAHRDAIARLGVTPLHRVTWHLT